MSRAVVLKPGDYDVFITLKEKSTAEIKDLAKAAPPKMAFVKHELSVPDYSGAELKMSNAILAATVEPLPAPLSPTQTEENPYSVFGAMKIVPSPTASSRRRASSAWSSSSTGAVMPAAASRTCAGLLVLHEQARREKYFNKTAPQEMNGRRWRPTSTVAAGTRCRGCCPSRWPASRRATTGWKSRYRQGVQQDDHAERQLHGGVVVTVVEATLGPPGDRAGTARAREMRHTRLLGSAAAVGLCLTIPALPASAQVVRPQLVSRTAACRRPSSRVSSTIATASACRRRGVRRRVRVGVRRVRSPRAASLFARCRRALLCPRASPGLSAGPPRLMQIGTSARGGFTITW
jgi:hypothetical protein